MKNEKVKNVLKFDFEKDIEVDNRTFQIKAKGFFKGAVNLSYWHGKDGLECDCGDSGEMIFDEIEITEYFDNSTFKTISEKEMPANLESKIFEIAENCAEWECYLA